MSRDPSRRIPESTRSIRLDDGCADRIGCARQPAVPRPGPLQIQTERLGQREHPQTHRRSRHSPPPRDPSSRNRRAPPPRAVPSTSWMPGSAESSSGATSPRSDSGKRAASGPAVSTQRAPSRASVSSASASRTPPAVGQSGVQIAEHPGWSPLTCWGERDPEDIARGMGLIGGHDQHPPTGTRRREPRWLPPASTYLPRPCRRTG